jgi:transposase InsO family protein
MLAVVFGAEKFHNYVWGRHFTIESDHKPLEVITQKTLADTPARLQRMLLRMQGYDYTLKYIEGSKIPVADTLSHYNPCEGKEIALDTTIHCVIKMSDDARSSLKADIQSDPEMQELLRLIIDGWPEDIQSVPKPLHSYWRYKDSMSVEDGLILKGEALVIPQGQRERTLKSLHKSHQGVTKTQLLARNMVFWPGYSSQIEDMIKGCRTCMQYQPQQAATPLVPTPAPSRPWQIVATDLFDFGGRTYLVVGDHYSKMHMVRKYPKGNSSSNKTIQFLKEIFSENGIPETLRSDNGPQFSSYEFKEFCQTWHIEHATSSPLYPKSNGFAEAMVKITKGALQRAKDSGSDPHLALLDLRATPVDSHLPSPAELLNRRRFRTTIPSKIWDNQED